MVLLTCAQHALEQQEQQQATAGEVSRSTLLGQEKKSAATQVTSFMLCDPHMACFTAKIGCLGRFEAKIFFACGALGAARDPPLR